MKEEFDMEKVSRKPETTINIGDVAVLNVGTIYGSVHGTIEKIGDKEIANVLKQFLKVIESSQLKKAEKIEHMHHIEFLAEQAMQPAEKRKQGIIKTVMTSLSVCADLQTLWSTYGQILMNFFDLK